MNTDNLSLLSIRLLEGLDDQVGKASLAPIGRVNLKTHSNSLFGNVFNGWGEGSGKNLLVIGGGGSIKAVVHTADNGSSTPVGYQFQAIHDQTRRDLGIYKVIGVFDHTSDGLRQLEAEAKSSSLPFYTFK